MKKYLCIAVFLTLMLSTAIAQTRNTSAVTRAPVGMASASGQFYEVLSDAGAADAQLLARELDGRFQLYNRIFHFDPQRLGNNKLRVRAFRDKDAYDAYVMGHLEKTTPGAVYLHYNQVDRRELVVHRGSPEEGRMFPHQVFVQYLRAFINNPPSWIREGFAIYFSSVTFDAGQALGTSQNAGLIYEENLAWLEVLKSLGNRLPTAETVLLADVKGGDLPENFHGVAWALISFMKDSGRGDYFRILYECFMLLKPDVSVQENSQTVFNHIRRWTDMPTLDRDYRAYLATRRTFAELITEGERAYNARDLESAKLSFQLAQRQRPSHFAPYYYLGLIAYDQRNFVEAELFYKSALQFGADSALIAYALGINAAAAGRNSDAIAFLEQAKALSPEQYGEQVDNLVRRLRN